MDPLSSSTAGVVLAKTTPAAADTANKIQKLAEEMKTLDPTTTEGSRRLMEINRQLMLFAGAPPAAGTSDIPAPPESRGLGQDVLDKAFSKIEELERQMKELDPTSPKDMAKMSEITRQLNRCDEMIRLVNEMRRSRHETNMAAINNIV